MKVTAWPRVQVSEGAKVVSVLLCDRPRNCVVAVRAFVNIGEADARIDLRRALRAVHEGHDLAARCRGVRAERAVLIAMCFLVLTGLEVFRYIEIVFYSNRFRRRALDTTDMELSAMAAPANIGLSSGPPKA